MCWNKYPAIKPGKEDYYVCWVWEKINQSYGASSYPKILKWNGESFIWETTIRTVYYPHKDYDRGHLMEHHIVKAWIEKPS